MGETGPLGIFLWMLSLAGGVELIGPAFSTAVILLPVLGYLLLRMPPESKKRLWQPLLLLPAIWVLLGLLGAVFWRDVGEPPNPGWLVALRWVAVALFVASALLFAWRLKGARLLLALYAAANAYFLAAMHVLSGLAMTGEWF